jgi:alanine-glyoxylate transaminase/serine-glyoxylate transaminase/serine-pyruvate transaminase
MSVGAGREFLAVPGPATIPDEVLRAMRRPDVEIYSKPMIALNDRLLCHLSRLSATAGRCRIYITNGYPAWKRR